MLVELNKTIPISFLVTDSYGVPQSNVAPTVTIKRQDTGYFYTGSTWQATEIALAMTYGFKGLYTYNFIPDAQTTYVTRCSETTFKVEGGAIFTVSSKLENCDVATSSRSTLTASDVWNFGTRTLSSFGTLVNDISVAIWSATNRTLTSFGNIISDIWSFASRTLSPTNIFGVGSCANTITILSGTVIQVYDNLNNIITETISNGVVVLYLNPGDYKLVCKNQGYYTQTLGLLVPNNATNNLTINLIPVTNDDNLGIDFRELSSQDLNIGETVNIGTECFSLYGKDFTINSAIAKLDTTDLVVSIIGSKVYAKVSPTVVGNITVVFTVVIGVESYVYKLIRKVV